MTNEAAPTKLVVTIVSGNDGERLMQALVRAGLPATKIRSSGGFLRRGNTTILSGVPANQVNAVLDLIRETCPVRTEMTTVQSLPIVGPTASASPLEVRTGGAVTFVVDIERFERV
jgi:uncharacterized protein YaaQ